jgi:phospholipase C
MSTLSRRRALQAFSAIVGATAVGCASEEETANEVGAQEDDLTICIGRMDRAVKDRQGPSALHKYEKFVVLMMENRSFDHYFGHLTIPKELGGEGRGKWDGKTPDPGGKLIDGLTGNESNPDLDGNPIKVFHPDTYALGDIIHDWDACHAQFAGGKMDGFIRAHQRDILFLNDNDESTKALCFGTTTGPGGTGKCANLADPMAFYTRKDTPIFHSLYENYAICDRYFCSVMGSTWPNRYYLHAASSRGEKGNLPFKNTGHGDKTFWQALRKKCLSARNYYQDIPWIDGAYPGAVMGRAINTARIFDNQPILNLKGGNGFVPEFVRNAFDHNTFETDCREGTLPTVSVIDPGFLAVPNDDHPPHDVQAGQTLIAAIYKLLTMNEEQWKKTLFIITYDEHGSFYDHVKPGVAPAEEREDFRQLGVRVPCLVVGPYVKKNYVSHVEYDHTSIISTLTRRFGLDPLNDRVRTANGLEDCIDLDALERSVASPALLPKTFVRESHAQDSIAESFGQSQLADRLLGGPLDREQKRIATNEFLHAADRLGVATIGS